MRLQHFQTTPVVFLLEKLVQGVWEKGVSFTIYMVSDGSMDVYGMDDVIMENSHVTMFKRKQPF
jgi:hypothetical protein